MSTMMINPLAAPPDTGATANNPASANPASSDATSANSLSTEFLRLLIAQLKNQNPENPADGTTFVTQLAQFTSVQQETQSTTDLGSILSLLQQAAASANGGTATNGAADRAATNGAPADVGPIPAGSSGASPTGSPQTGTS